MEYSHTDPTVEVFPFNQIADVGAPTSKEISRLGSMQDT